MQVVWQESCSCYRALVPLSWCPQVQRPVTESTLECEALVKELETDADNEGVIYVAGLKKIQSEKEVQEKLSYLQGLKAVFLPRSSRSGRRRKSCFLSMYAMRPSPSKDWILRAVSWMRENR